MNPRVKDVMTDQVVAVRRTATVKQMASALRRFRVSGLPVVDEHDRVIGVVSEADLLARTGRLQRSDHDKADGLTADQLMTHPAVTVGPADSVEHAAQLMHNLRIKRLPVADAGGRLVGIVSRADALAVYDRPDEQIREEILDEVIAHQLLEDPRQFSVTVEAGVVTLQGSPQTSRLGREIVRRAARVQGVVKTRDRLSYPADPSTAPPPS